MQVIFTLLAITILVLPSFAHKNHKGQLLAMYRSKDCRGEATDFVPIGLKEMNCQHYSDYYSDEARSYRAVGSDICVNRTIKQRTLCQKFNPQHK